MADSRDNDERLLEDTDSMQRFTATGRRYTPPTKAEKQQAGLSNIGLDTSFGNMPANHVPFRYTDDSLIGVPVMLPEDVGKPTPAAEPKKKFWQSRRTSGVSDRFVIKKVTRGDYLKHYAKDDEGRFCGTGEPAEDCLLRGPDLEKWRGSRGSGGGIGGFKHEIEDGAGMSTASTNVSGYDDGVIR